MPTELSKYPVKSAPQKTYTYALKGRFRFSVAATVVFGIFCLCIISLLLLWGLGIGMAIFILLFVMPLPVFALVLGNRKKNGFITIAPEGLTFGGALNVKDGIKSDFSQEDYNKVSHFGWEQIRSVGFTRDLMKPSFLFVELTDGETYYYPLLDYYDDFVIVDTLRKFTGYSGCKDLGRYVAYAKQLKSRRLEASPPTRRLAQK